MRGIPKHNQARRASRAMAEALELRTLLSTTPVVAIDPPFTGAAPAPAQTVSDSSSGATVAASLTAPSLSSLPGAPATLYLNFTGDDVPSWDGGTYSPGVIPAYDTDGNASSFSSTELSNINEIWARVAEKYSPFDINITTVDPHSYPVGKVTKVDIGGDDTWLGQSAGGISLVGGFSQNFGAAGNTAFVFPPELADGFPKYVAEAASHEAGHTFGLYHHSIFDSNGNVVTEYDPGDSLVAPVMGVSYDAARGLWYDAPADENGVETPEDDMLTISDATNGFGYRPDDVGNTPASATPLTINGLSVTAAGVITQTTDIDYFSFNAAAGALNISVSPATFGPTLDATLEVRNASNTVIASADTTALGETINVTLPSAGTYYVDVKSEGMYGDVGQYTLSGTLPVSSFRAVPGGPYSVAEGSSIQLSGSAAGGTAVSYAWDFDYDGSTFNTDATGATPTFSAANLDGPATQTIALEVTDNIDTTSIVTTTVNITNVNPTATFSSNSPVLLTGTGIVTFTNPFDPSTADISAGFKYSYDFNNDGIYDLVNTTASSATVPSADLSTLGSHTIRGRIIDKDGGFTDYTTVIVVNDKPAATFSNSGPVAEDTTATVSFTAPAGGTAPYTYSYDLDDDGSFDITNTTATTETIPATLLSDGPSLVVVRGRITDSAGAFADYTTTITVNNVAPTTTLAGAPLSSPNEGSTITFSGSATDVPADAVAGFTFTWSATRNGVSVASATGASFPLSLDDNGAYIVSLTATDKDGGVSLPATASFNVLNVPPTVTLAGTNATFLEGSSVSLTAQGADVPADAGTLTYAWSVRQSNTIIATGSTAAIAFLPNDNGIFIVTATAADKDGGTSTAATATLHVLNVAPTATFSAASASVPEGSTGDVISFIHRADPSSADVAAGFHYEYDFNNDGVFDLTTTSASTSIPAQYLADGPADVTVRGRILDKDGGFADYTTTVHVTNVPPTLHVTGDPSAVAQSPYTLTLSSTDPGQDTISNWHIDWGDGTTQDAGANPPPVTHEFPTSGEFLVYVTATDEDGTYSAPPLSVEAAPAPPPSVVDADTSPPTAFAGSLNPPPAGANNYAFQVTFSDDTALNLSSINGNDIQVIAPGGATLPVAFLGFANSSPTSATANFQFTPPGGAFNAASSGTYSLAVLPDTVFDAAGNGMGMTPLGQFTKVVPSQAADLTAQVIAHIPAQTQPGYTGSATLRVANHGDLPASGPMTMTLYLSTNNTLDSADIHLAATTTSVTLPQGQSKDFTLSYTLPSSLASGKYFLLGAVADHVVELNDVNNVAVGATTTVSRPFVDLRPSKLAIKSASKPGGKIATTFQLANAGTAPANGSVKFTATLVPSRSTTVGTSLGSFLQSVQLKAGTSKSASLNFAIPANMQPGTYFVLLTVTPSLSLGDKMASDKQIFSNTPIAV